ncbi:Cell division control protein A [Spatholobus suberectus]|nr:Cell division control protein A [Spatholobus suberectus]
MPFQTLLTLTHQRCLLILDPSRVMGTPTEEQWPGVTSLPNWISFPEWAAQNLAEKVGPLRTSWSGPSLG